jgi:hypothetical protein
MWIKWMIAKGVQEGTTSLPMRRNIAVWVDKAMTQMKEEQQIIKNAWLKTWFDWFDKQEGEGVLGVLGGVEGIVCIYQLTQNNFVVIFTYKLIVLLFVPGNYCRMATPFIFMKRAALRGVAADRICIKNMGNLRQRSVEACCLLHHVAL